jgi:hypothetical protein
VTNDARFEDGKEAPLNLSAEDVEDLNILSTLVQDAIFPAIEMRWHAKERRFALLLNRFRWEDRDAASRSSREFERVQAVLLIGDVMKISSQGVQKGEVDTILSLLSLGFEGGEDGTGRLILTLAGDGAIAIDVECINVTLKDVTRPYVAPSRKAPNHPD